jgi:outer membrane receptor protein involved in Fe transport
MQTSGFDWSLSTRRPVGNGELSLGIDGTYTRTYDIKALQYNNVELVSGTEGAGKLNRFNPLAWPLPRWKWSVSAGYHGARYSAIGNVNYISSYEDDLNAGDPAYAHRVIDAFGTFDATLMMRLTDNIDAFVTGFNLFDSAPPLVNQEGSYDGLTHDPKGRRIKAGMTYTIN